MQPMKAAATRIGQRLNFLVKAIQSPQFNWDDFDYLLESLILIGDRIEELIRIVRSLGIGTDLLKELHGLRKVAERALRRLRLQMPSSEQEFEADLMWMSEQGEPEDLTLLYVIKNDPPFTSKHIERLIEIAIRSIEQREKAFPSAQPQAYNTGGQVAETFPRLSHRDTPDPEKSAVLRVFCPREARKEFPDGTHTLQDFDAFLVVSASQAAASELRKRFPVETLEMGTPSKGWTVGEMVMRNMVVQFIGPICDEWNERIKREGATIIQPLDNSTIIISIDSAEALERVSSLNVVQSVYSFDPDIRVTIESLHGLDQDLTEKLQLVKAAEAKAPYSDLRGTAIPGLLIASFFTREYRDRAAKELSARGIDVVSQPGDKRLIVDIGPTENALSDLVIISRLEGLRVLEEETVETPSNDIARRVVMEGSIATDQNPTALVGSGLGLTGKGQVIAIADSGLDTGDKSTLHQDFRGRVRFIKRYPIRDSLAKKAVSPSYDDGPAADLYSGHGTHVAGSAVGNGAQAKALKNLPLIQGTAPEAELVFQAVERAIKLKNGICREFFGIPDDLKKLFEEAYDNEARIHSNSWGGGKVGDYNSRCEDIDEFVWNHKDFLVVVAAGNNGKQSFSNPKCIDQPSIEPPGTAKNCLTVGASENERKDLNFTYARFSDKYFHRDPFYSHIMTDSADHIAAFSSRGPCPSKPKKPDDVLRKPSSGVASATDSDPDQEKPDVLRGRRKPDVVAPGTFILSTRSSQVPELGFPWVPYSQAKSHYIYCSGTSMAAPLVAGCAALVRQHLRNLPEERNIENPSAALLKAALIHSTRYLDDHSPHPSSSGWADNEQGWGRVNLRSIIAPDAPTQIFFIDEDQGLATGKKQVYELEINKVDEEAVIANEEPTLRITLVYTDFPGENLENNLNLFLHSPERDCYVGNYFKDKDERDSISYPEDEKMPEPDSMNNVEGIIVKNPVAGVWTVEVVASLVKHGTQDFALVISGYGLTRVTRVTRKE